MAQPCRAERLWAAPGRARCGRGRRSTRSGRGGSVSPHAAAGLAVVASACAVVAVEVEKRADVFGIARAEGRFVLEPMSAEEDAADPAE